MEEKTYLKTMPFSMLLLSIYHTFSNRIDALLKAMKFHFVSQLKRAWQHFKVNDGIKKENLFENLNKFSVPSSHILTISLSVKFKLFRFNFSGFLLMTKLLITSKITRCHLKCYYDFVINFALFYRVKPSHIENM